MIRLINAEIFKLRKRFMTWVLLYVMIGIIVILYFTLLAVSNAQLPARAEEAHATLTNLLGLPVALPFALSILSSLGSILAVILLASSIGFEYNWRTIRTMLISSEGRLKLLIAKLISALIFILIGMIIALAAGFIMSLITTAIGHYSFDFSFITRITPKNKLLTVFFVPVYGERKKRVSKTKFGQEVKADGSTGKKYQAMD